MTTDRTRHFGERRTTMTTPATAINEARQLAAEELQAQLDIVKQFLCEHSDFVRVLAQYQGEDMSDYHRWTGHAEARRVLAQALGIKLEGAVAA